MIRNISLAVINIHIFKKHMVYDLININQNFVQKLIVFSITIFIFRNVTYTLNSFKSC